LVSLVVSHCCLMAISSRRCQDFISVRNRINDLELHFFSGRTALSFGMPSVASGRGFSIRTARPRSYRIIFCKTKVGEGVESFLVFKMWNKVIPFPFQMNLSSKLVLVKILLCLEGFIKKCVNVYDGRPI
jgi:hypothetical protein